VESEPGRGSRFIVRLPLDPGVWIGKIDRTERIAHTPHYRS
jgi:hypothetical protein